MLVLSNHVATALQHDGQRLLPHVVHGGPDLSQETQVRRQQVGGLLQSAEPVQVHGPVLGLFGGQLEVEGNVCTPVSIARHRASASVWVMAPAWWARICISVKQVSSVLSLQKLRTRLARSSRPSNISANWGYRACIEGRAATERSQDRSLANDGAAVTDVVLGAAISSVSIGMELY